MLTTDYYITKKSDIFFFYQIIAHTNAKSILDLGMFFERVGAVSRQIGDAELPEDSAKETEEEVIGTYEYEEGSLAR